MKKQFWSVLLLCLIWLSAIIQQKNSKRLNHFINYIEQYNNGTGSISIPKSFQVNDHVLFIIIELSKKETLFQVAVKGAQPSE
jgi:hypothetical protein